jgi:AraC family transcriptional regulator
MSPAFESLSVRHLGEDRAVDRPAVADYPSGAHMPTRVIDDYELVWMLRGTARLVTNEGAVDLPPGRLLLLPPAVEHGIEWDRRRPSRHGYVHFGPEHFGRGRPVPRDVQVRAMTPRDPLDGLCAYLLWLGRHDGDWRPHAHDALRFLLAVFLAGPLPGTDEPPPLPVPLEAAIAHLRREWAVLPLRRVTVEDLARAAAISRGYLNRLFHEAFGRGPAPALERARCSRVETLLARTDLTVESIARQCGFADLSHLSHRFRAIHALSPRAYRSAGHRVPSVLDEPGVRRLVQLIWD